MRIFLPFLGRVLLARLRCGLVVLGLALGPTAAAAAEGQERVEAPAASGGFGAKLTPRRPARPAPSPALRAQEESVSEIEMFVGESRVFPAPRVARVAVGSGSLLTAAALDGKEVILFANAAGTSSLFIWGDDGAYQRLKVSIVAGDTGRIAREIAAFLAAVPEVRTSVIGDKVIVEGERLADSELAKIDELARRYPQLVNFTNRVGWDRMVLMELKVVEFPVTELREIGIRWTTAGGAAVGALWSPGRRGSQDGLQVDLGSVGGVPPISSAAGVGQPIPVPRGLNILSAINAGLVAKLNLLAQDGRATILAEPRLSARSGTQASFLAGGEVPFQVSTLSGTTVQFKPYGIRLEIEPRVDASGTIRARIDSEVSSIDPAYSVSAGPALLTRRTRTEFNLRDGETLVLAGLLSRRSSDNVDKVPLLGDLPVLGHLFRSRRFQNEETELVIFVTPTVVDAESRGGQEAIRKAESRLHPSHVEPASRLPGGGVPDVGRN